MIPILALLPHRTTQEFSLFFEDAYRFQFIIPIEYQNPISENY